MSQSTDNLKNDIAYLSALARDGAKPTYAGGEFLLMAGLVFGLTSLAVAASLGGYLPVSMTVLWLISLVAFAVTLPILIVRIRRSGSYRMLADRAVGHAWTAIGWAIFTIALCIGLFSWRTGNGDAAFLFGPIILALYGVGWSVSATLSDRVTSQAIGRPWPPAAEISAAASASRSTRRAASATLAPAAARSSAR